MDVLILIVAARIAWYAPDWGRKVLAFLRDFDAYREERRRRHELEGRR